MKHPPRPIVLTGFLAFSVASLPAITQTSLLANCQSRCGTPLASLPARPPPRVLATLVLRRLLFGHAGPAVGLTQEGPVVWVVLVEVTRCLWLAPRPHDLHARVVGVAAVLVEDLAVGAGALHELEPPRVDSCGVPQAPVRLGPLYPLGRAHETSLPGDARWGEAVERFERRVSAVVVQELQHLEFVPLGGAVHGRPTGPGLGVHQGAPLEQQSRRLEVAAPRGVQQSRVGVAVHLVHAVFDPALALFGRGLAAPPARHFGLLLSPHLVQSHTLQHLVKDLVPSVGGGPVDHVAGGQAALHPP
mmetsp:Transcript_45708/g.103213  ORF Transcript_45708/g.103213 Transcript_45708/m.103213 type:complete len:303 (+) Transcript_45708:32-940(+)